MKAEKDYMTLTPRQRKQLHELAEALKKAADDDHVEASISTIEAIEDQLHQITRQVWWRTR